MNLPPELLQFLGSLLAIFALAGVARWLKLGDAATISNEAQARAAAMEAVDGYEPSEIAIDDGGKGAIMRNRSGQLLLLKPHGNKFAARILTSRASASADGNLLTINSGERRYGSMTLKIDDAQAWAEAINALNRASDA